MPARSSSLVFLGKGAETRSLRERAYEGSRHDTAAQVLDHYTGRPRSGDSMSCLSAPTRVTRPPGTAWWCGPATRSAT